MYSSLDSGSTTPADVYNSNKYIKNLWNKSTRESLFILRPLTRELGCIPSAQRIPMIAKNGHKSQKYSRATGRNKKKQKRPATDPQSPRDHRRAQRFSEPLNTLYMPRQLHCPRPQFRRYTRIVLKALLSATVRWPAILEKYNLRGFYEEVGWKSDFWTNEFQARRGKLASGVDRWVLRLWSSLSAIAKWFLRFTAVRRK